MNTRNSLVPTRRRRGFSLVEITVSVFILLVVISLTIGATIYYARVAKGLITYQRMQQQLALYLQDMANEMIRSTEVEFIDSTRIRIKRPRYNASGEQVVGFVARDIVYVDLDNNPNTIDGPGANRLIAIEDPTTPAPNTEELLLSWVSPATAGRNPIPIFQEIQQGGRRYIQVTMRLGDRANPSTDEWDRYTGPGYQGFFVQSALISNNAR